MAVLRAQLVEAELAAELDQECLVAAMEDQGGLEEPMAWRELVLKVQQAMTPRQKASVQSWRSGCRKLRHHLKT